MGLLSSLNTSSTVLYSYYGISFPSFLHPIPLFNYFSAADAPMMMGMKKEKSTIYLME
jgi:hypothetical protein